MLATEDISAYEGLVGKTAEMFAGMIGVEYEDLRQDLFIKVMKAQRSYDSKRSRMTERAYVYACLANYVKDLKRDAARRKAKVRIDFIEDLGQRHGTRTDGGTPDREGRYHDPFEHRYLVAELEQLGVQLPSSVTQDETRVLVLLLSGYARTEIAVKMTSSLWQVGLHIKALREKLADWRTVPVAA